MQSDPTSSPPRLWNDEKTGVTYIGAAVPKPAALEHPPTKSGGGDDPPPGPTSGERKFAAKRHNECVKVFATWMNTVSGVAIGAAAIIPAVKGMEAFVREFQPVWFFVGLALHFVGQAALRFEMRSEE